MADHLEELYFTLRATADEHDIVEYDYVRPFCRRAGLELVYYRKFKTGHIPTHREIKIRGSRRGLAIFKRWCDTRPCPITRENYWRTEEWVKEKAWRKLFES